MTDCFCDYDSPEWWHSKIHCARKSHRCEECGATIKPGEQYEYVAGKWEGHLDEFKTCLRCLEIRRYVTDMVPCFCWVHGNLHNDAKDAISEYAHELPGMAFGLGRRLIAARRHAMANVWVTA